MSETANEENGDGPVTCPHCEKEFHLRASARIPASQMLVMTLEFESEFCAAETIGEMLTNTAKCMSSVAEGLETRVATFVKDIVVGPQKIVVTLLVADVKA